MANRRSFTRKTGFRDAKLIVIATEGERTEKAYFEYLKKVYFSPGTHVEVLDRADSGSDPQRILNLIDGFRNQYSLRPGLDQLWVVIDVDHWGNQKLSSVSSQCSQKGYYLAISNPAFELWLLMHIRKLESYSADELKELLENKKENNRTRLEHELINLFGYYNKSNLDMNCFTKRVKFAIENARQNDINPEDRWPNGLGTRVYLLVEQIVNGKLE